jgi:Flp pilus assembly protein TadG
LFNLHKRGRREGGQTLILVTLALPLFLALMSLVVDGGNILVHKRNIQVAADAAALAIAQSVDLASANCPNSCSNEGSAYAQKNGVDITSAWHKCNDPDPANPTDTNCWAYPYVDTSGVSHQDQVEVRLRAHVTTFLAGVIGIYGANVSARAVASTNPVTSTTTSPNVTISGTTQTITGSTLITTDPDILSGDSGVAFAMSRRCNAITYSGNPKGQALGAFATNGGLAFGGAGNPKHVKWLAYDQANCPPPSGITGSNCTAIAWGDPTDSASCVKTLTNLHAPVNWPIAPPTPPTLRSGTWNASRDFGLNCINLGSGPVVFTTSGNPPGVYCVNGSGASLTINNVGDLTTGDGYTFFALGGSTITVASGCGNPICNRLQFYWPSACGSRPTTRTTSFTCFGRTISGYDPQTFLYATNPSANGTTCAICLQGNGNDLTGDIFATQPNTFPPAFPPGPGGGLVAISGGGLAAGKGFIESWLLTIDGNTGNYQGTGTSLVIPGQTHTTIDPGTTTTTPDTIISGTVGTTTIGSTLALTQ